MRLKFMLGYAVVAAIAVGSVAIALLVHDRESATFEQRQQAEAIRSARQAEALAALSVGQLDSAAAFYEAEGTAFGQRDFEAIADSLLENGALSATGFTPLVRSGERRRFERRSGVVVRDRGRLGELRRAPRRARYFPLSFAATNAPLDVATPYGYDLGADPVRSAHLLAARDSGRSAATPVIRLPLGGKGINVFLPVYRNGAPTATVAQRRAALTGFAVGSFRVGDLSAAALTALEADDEIQLIDHGRTVAGVQLDRDASAAAQLHVADRSWTLVVHDSNRPGIGLPALIAGIGIALAALLGSLVLVWSRSERMQELRRQAGQDPLTGLKNRRRFEEEMGTELARARREGSAGAVLMLDLDNFKQVNDTLGHPAGDRTIAEVAGVLVRRMRATDVVARLGGDEFAIVLPHCELDEAEEVAEAIGREIRLQAPPAEAAPPLTASIGIATFGPNSEDYDAVLTAADNALYEAKHAGRNSIRVAGQAISA